MERLCTCVHMRFAEIERTRPAQYTLCKIALAHGSNAIPDQSEELVEYESQERKNEDGRHHRSEVTDVVGAEDAIAESLAPPAAR